MKKVFLLISTIFLFTTISSAQSKDSSIKRVIWSKDARCSDLNLPAVQNENPQCVEQETDGATFYIIYYNNISLAISFPRSLDANVSTGLVQINNKSGKSIFVDVEKSFVAVYEDEDSFRKGEKNKQSKTLLNAQKLADQIWYRSVMEASSGAVGQATRVKSTVNSQGETILNPIAPNGAGGRYETSTTSSKSQRKEMVESALNSKTLADQDKTAGRIYFKHYLDAKYKVIFARIDNMEFIFPVKYVFPVKITNSKK